MEDKEIVSLYWKRDERAVSETSEKYGAYCYAIAYNILSSPEDAEESVNDTWVGAWESMPPHKPDALSAFLGKITRRISLKRWRNRNAAKRGGGVVELALEELKESIPAGQAVEDALAERELPRLIDAFLDVLPDVEQRVFVRRYWYLDSIADIAKRFGFTQSKIKSMLHRTRRKLRDYLRKEGAYE
ncbi:MAG: sigma-70 family RNA polymerase sigma factor [Oscillibacter sp.]|nr:sigma-70 family RNA polymerase sigma factor [Oscillibacter sp.]